MPNNQIKSLTVDGVTYDIVDKTSGYIQAHCVEVAYTNNEYSLVNATHSDIDTWINNDEIVILVYNNEWYLYRGYYAPYSRYYFASVIGGQFYVNLDDSVYFDNQQYANQSDIPQNTSDLYNDSGFISTETDPTVPAWAKASTKPSYTAQEVGAVATGAVGAASGVAPLNASSKIDSTYLPSYVDDVIEGYYYNNKFWEEGSHTTEIPGEAGKIYVDLSTDKTYRYSGSAFVEISKGGSVVTVSRDLTSGSKVGIVNVDGTSYQFYAPTPPTKTSDLTNDSGFVNASQAASAAPVQSVNGQTGVVVLDAEDVGAMHEDATFALVYDEAVSVGSAVVGTAVTGQSNYTPSGIVQTTSTEVLTGGTVALSYTYSNYKLTISGITFTPTKTNVVVGAAFQGTGVNFAIEQEN